MRLFQLSLLLLMFTAVSCGGNEKPECKDCNVKKEDTITEKPADDLQSALAKENTAAPTQEMKENHEKIVKKYGEQWDFCKCVVANDSINDAFEKKLTPEQEAKLMARWDYVDLKCKELTTFDNTTPEEREKHDKKVMKCLKQNGLKK